jgi:hypothetical protein
MPATTQASLWPAESPSGEFDDRSSWGNPNMRSTRSRFLTRLHFLSYFPRLLQSLPALPQDHGQHLLRAGHDLTPASSPNTDPSKVRPSSVREYITSLPSRRERTSPWERRTLRWRL